MEVVRKPFKVIELQKDGNEPIRVEEGSRIKIVVDETGEVFEGIVSNVSKKKITIKINGENCERIFITETITISNLSS